MQSTNIFQLITGPRLSSSIENMSDTVLKEHYNKAYHGYGAPFSLAEIKKEMLSRKIKP